MGILKPQSHGLLYSNTVIGTLAVVGWDVTFGTAKRGLGGLWPLRVPSSTTQWPEYQLHVIQCGTIIAFAV